MPGGPCGRRILFHTSALSGCNRDSDSSGSWHLHACHCGACTGLDRFVIEKSSRVGTGVPSRGVRRCPRGGRGKRGPAACREVLSSQHWGSASCYAVLLCLGFHELHSCYGAAWVSTTLLMLLCRSVDTLLQAWMRPARWPVLPEGVLACPHSAFHLYQSCVVA